MKYEEIMELLDWVFEEGLTEAECLERSKVARRKIRDATRNDEERREPSKTALVEDDPPKGLAYAGGVDDAERWVDDELASLGIEPHHVPNLSGREKLEYYNDILGVRFPDIEGRRAARIAAAFAEGLDDRERSERLAEVVAVLSQTRQRLTFRTRCAERLQTVYKVALATVNDPDADDDEKEAVVEVLEAAINDHAATKSA